MSDVSVTKVRGLKILSHWGGLESQRGREFYREKIELDKITFEFKSVVLIHYC